jgi:predicted RNA-binding protein
MCEFNVIFDGRTQFRDVIYVRVEGENVIVRNILGESKEFKGCKIVEVDVNYTRLVLASIKS